MNSVEYRVLPKRTTPYGSFGRILKMLIYYALVFLVVETEVMGGGGVVCIRGRVKPGVGSPTGKPGTDLDTVLSKSYGLFVGFSSGFAYFFLSFLTLCCSFFLVLSLDELDESSDESSLLEELE
jgi:hypothetical protein